jgi:hypothetical protein
MRPGKHTAPSGERTEFLLEDIQLYVGPTHYLALTIPVALFATIPFITYPLPHIRTLSMVKLWALAGAAITTAALLRPPLPRFGTPNNMLHPATLLFVHISTTIPVSMLPPLVWLLALPLLTLVCGPYEPAPGSTPLCTYFNNNTSFYVTASNITSTRCSSLASIGLALGFAPADISVWSLPASGAMALLCANVDPNMIHLLMRWRVGTCLI